MDALKHSEQEKTHYFLGNGFVELKKLLGLRRLLQTQRLRHRIGYRPDIPVGIVVPNVNGETLVLRSPENHSGRIGKCPPHRRVSRYPETIWGCNARNTPDRIPPTGVGILTKYSGAWSITHMSGEERRSKEYPAKHRQKYCIFPHHFTPLSVAIIASFLGTTSL